MAEGRRREAWDHTAAVMSLLANIHRDPRKGKAFKPEDFHPLVDRSRPRKVTKMRDLKHLFVKEA